MPEQRGRNTLQWRHSEHPGVSNHRRLVIRLAFCLDLHQRKHQNSRYWPLGRGIHRWPVHSPHKPSNTEPFSLDVVIMNCVCMYHIKYKKHRTITVNHIWKPTVSKYLPILPRRADWYIIRRWGVSNKFNYAATFVYILTTMHSMHLTMFVLSILQASLKQTRLELVMIDTCDGAFGMYCNPSLRIYAVKFHQEE